MKSRFAVAVLTALLVFPFTAKAQMPGSDIAWMRTCSAEREAFQAAIHRTYGTDTLKAADEASKAEFGLHDIFNMKKSLDGQVAGQSAASLRPLLADVQTLVSENMARLNPQAPPSLVTYTRCVLIDVANFAQAKIQARLDEISKATQGSADYTPAPIPTYTAPAQRPLAPPPPAPPSAGDFASTRQLGCVSMKQLKNSTSGFWVVDNQCGYRAIGFFCYEDNGINGCGQKHTPSGFGPITPGKQEGVSGPDAQGEVEWRVAYCDYDLWVKGQCKASLRN